MNQLTSLRHASPINSQRFDGRIPTPERPSALHSNSVQLRSVRPSSVGSLATIPPTLCGTTPLQDRTCAALGQPQGAMEILTSCVTGRNVVDAAPLGKWGQIYAILKHFSPDRLTTPETSLRSQQEINFLHHMIPVVQRTLSAGSDGRLTESSFQMLANITSQAVVRIDPRIGGGVRLNLPGTDVTIDTVANDFQQPMFKAIDRANLTTLTHTQKLTCASWIRDFLRTVYANNNYFMLTTKNFFEMLLRHPKTISVPFF